jgi:hypothetical protein
MNKKNSYIVAVLFIFLTTTTINSGWRYRDGRRVWIDGPVDTAAAVVGTALGGVVIDDDYDDYDDGYYYSRPYGHYRGRRSSRGWGRGGGRGGGGHSGGGHSGGGHR